MHAESLGTEQILSYTFNASNVVLADGFGLRGGIAPLLIQLSHLFLCKLVSCVLFSHPFEPCDLMSHLPRSPANRAVLGDRLLPQVVRSPIRRVLAISHLEAEAATQEDLFPPFQFLIGGAFVRNGVSAHEDGRVAMFLRTDTEQGSLVVQDRVLRVIQHDVDHGRHVGRRVLPVHVLTKLHDPLQPEWHTRRGRLKQRVPEEVAAANVLSLPGQRSLGLRRIEHCLVR